MTPVESLPLVPFRRVVLPGARHSVRTTYEGLGVGERVAVVLIQPDGTLGRVGTAARIQGLADDQDSVVLDLIGEVLVSIERTGDRASVDVIDRVPPVPRQGLVLAAEKSLRRYMAARAESGHGGDIHLTIGPDPVTASHQVASHLEISWPEVQDILEAGNACERLEREITVLERETALLRAVLGRSE
jgi:hypothetical protein